MRLPRDVRTDEAAQHSRIRTSDVPATRFEAVMSLVEFVPNVTAGRRTHPAPEAGYILEGEVTLSATGQPDKRLKTGESIQVPAGAVHDARSGPRGIKALVTYFVDKRQPPDLPAD